MPLWIQIIGSTLVLLAFVAAQAGRMQITSRVYLALNAIGSSGLAVSAAAGSQWGFLALEGVWTAVSVAGLVRR